ncbi:MAG TPA: M23 family metallopeptidase [Bacteroidota bacterium]|nr:M23 family metallopeptidase [Bacteroidota bacterium]
MPQEGTRRKKSPRLYNVVIVPVEEGGKTRSFRTSRLTIVALCLLGTFATVAVTLALLVYTPLALYVPIPNPGLEQKYGRQILEMQRRLNALAEEVVLVRDYNTQVRKALGEGGPRDSSAARRIPAGQTSDQAETEQPERTLRHADQSVNGSTVEPVLDDLSNPTGFASVVTATGPARTSFPMLAPVEGFVTQGFDPSHNHFGMDIAAQRGTPVHAPGDGVVLFAGWTYDDGNMLIIAHGGGYCTVYKHNQTLLKSALASVKRGEPIALLGMSGRTSVGPHLHFEVWKNGIPQDPNEYLLVPVHTQQ